jgi:hypothetical protein
MRHTRETVGERVERILPTVVIVAMEYKGVQGVQGVIKEG